MDTGQVRAILGIHFARLHPNAMPAAATDPNRLVESWALVEALRNVAALKGEAALREAAADYVALWSRTFRTLVRHLRGRPERAVALFAEEFYPFLRGDRLAARVETAQPGRATLLLLADLPEAYLAGLLQAFVALSGAKATVTPLRGGRFEVAYRVAPVHRLAYAAQQLAILRVPLLVAAALACLLGIAMAARDAEAALPWTRVAAVLAGGILAQLGANAWHDLRHPHPAGPLRLVGPTRRQSLWQARLGFAAAAACGLYLARDAPQVVAFAALGLAVSFLFGTLRSRGWGPLMAGLTYGPLMVLGAYHAFHPVAWPPAHAAATLLPSLALGASAAALVHLDDVADRPLDEAGGSRTLAVRLPRARQAVLFDLLLAAAVAAATGPIVWPLLQADVGSWTMAGWLVPLPFIVLAAAIATIVHGHLDDPSGLGPARLGAVVLHTVLAAALTVAAHAGWGSSLVGALAAVGLAAGLRAAWRSLRPSTRQPGTPA